MENTVNNITLYEEDISYNFYLYKKRLMMKMKRRKFAKMIGISSFRYRLIENGYIKPSKKDIEKLSKYFEIDYSYYCESTRSYPTELNHKKFMKLTNFLYHMFTKKKVRITFLVLFLLSLATLITSLCIVPSFSSSNPNIYEPMVKEFENTLREKGDNNFSLFAFNYPQASKNVKLDDTGDNQKSIIIKGSYKANSTSLSFSEIVWIDDYRFLINYNPYSSYDLWDITILNYQTCETETALLVDIDGLFQIIPITEKESYQILSNFIENNNIKEDFDSLIKEKLELDTTFDELDNSISATIERYNKVSLRLSIVVLFSIIFSLLLLFLFGYSSIYKKEKEEQFSFSHTDELLDLNPKMEEIKKDIRLFPFIPETFLKLLGILLVALGSFRLIFYTLNVTMYASDNIQTANQFYSIQLLGMFIIFFLNFDIYMDDYRIYRNLMLYPMVFFVVYLLEASVMQSITQNPSVVTMAMQNVMMPNPFASATCYFLIMLFLFFTPKYLKTKRSLIIYRSLSIIPILFIYVSFFLANLDTIFGIQINNQYFKYFFRGDRLPLSILAVTYLVSLFFLRLHFKKKYGEAKANKYFMGNKYLFIKNLIAFTLIMIIWIMEMIFKNNATLNKMGIGLNVDLIILAPLVLLYHPHKGTRNTKVDVTLITIYSILLVVIYFATGIVAIIGLVS